MPLRWKALRKQGGANAQNGVESRVGNTDNAVNGASLRAMASGKPASWGPKTDGADSEKDHVLSLIRHHETGSEGGYWRATETRLYPD